jgi:hypothetical protein
MAANVGISQRFNGIPTCLLVKMVEGATRVLSGEPFRYTVGGQSFEIMNPDQAMQLLANAQAELNLRNGQAVTEENVFVETPYFGGGPGR